MTIREQLTAVDELGELWALSLPGTTPPPSGTYASWLGTYPQSIIVYGLSRTASKARKLKEAGAPMDTEAATRYAASVMHHEAKGERRLPTRTPVAAIAA